MPFTTTAPKEAVQINISKKLFLPCYAHLRKVGANIDFYWGGRDSGKSQDIAQQLIIDCLQLPYFRCMLVKKTFDTIQGSQWQTLKDTIEKWGLSSLFTFRVAPLSIECKNGNKFIARGCNDHQSIKSTKDPSHCWIEEANQLSLEDFVTVITTLRSNKIRVKIRCSFNPEFEGDYEENWLWKTFIAGKETTGVYSWRLELPNGKYFDYTYTTTHTTYKHNKFVSIERIAFLEMLKGINEYLYRVFTLGLPGRRTNNAPFAYAFSREKHVGATEMNWRSDAMLSFDFNKRPITASIWQYDSSKHHLYGIESIKLENSNIYSLCDYINEHYPQVLWQVTGDATGAASSALVQDNLNYYTVIKEKLNLAQTQLKVPTVNPLLKENQVLVNAVLALVPTTLDRKRCSSLIYDLENVRVLADGSIEKRDRNDPAQQADSLDTFRYMCNTFFKWVLK